MLTVLVLLTLFVLHQVHIPSDRYTPLVLDWKGDPETLDEVVARLERARVHIRRRSMSRRPNRGDCRATLILRYRSEARVREVVDALQADPRFDRVSWN